MKRKTKTRRCPLSKRRKNPAPSSEKCYLLECSEDTLGVIMQYLEPGSDWFNIKLTCKRLNSVGTKYLDPSIDNNLYFRNAIFYHDCAAMHCLIKDKRVNPFLKPDDPTILSLLERAMFGKSNIMNSLVAFELRDYIDVDPVAIILESSHGTDGEFDLEQYILPHCFVNEEYRNQLELVASDRRFAIKEKYTAEDFHKVHDDAPISVQTSVLSRCTQALIQSAWYGDTGLFDAIVAKCTFDLSFMSYNLLTSAFSVYNLDLRVEIVTHLLSYDFVNPNAPPAVPTGYIDFVHAMCALYTGDKALKAVIDCPRTDMHTHCAIYMDTAARRTTLTEMIKSRVTREDILLTVGHTIATDSKNLKYFVEYLDEPDRLSTIRYCIANNLVKPIHIIFQRTPSFTFDLNETGELLLAAVDKPDVLRVLIENLFWQTGKEEFYKTVTACIDCGYVESLESIISYAHIFDDVMYMMEQFLERSDLRGNANIRAIIMKKIELLKERAVVNSNT